MPVTTAAQVKQKAWALIRLAVLDRDGKRCVVCASKSDLTAHHIVSRREGGRDTMRNLISLCGLCHDRAESLGWAWIQQEKERIASNTTTRKTSMKFNIKDISAIPLKPGEHISQSKTDGKLRVWGRDRRGVYSVEIEVGNGMGAQTESSKRQSIGHSESKKGQE